MQTDPTIASDPPVPPKKPRRASARFMLTHPLHILSLGFGSGLSPIAPGTVGTLFAWVSFVVFNPHLTVAEWAVLIAVGFVAGCWFCAFTAKQMGLSDPSPWVRHDLIPCRSVYPFIPAS